MIEVENMKKSSKIILTIAGIFGLIDGIALMLVGLIYGLVVVFGGAEAMPQIAAELQAAFDESGVEMNADVIVWVIRIILGLIIMLGYGALGLFELITGIIALKGAKAKKKGILIANIVFGALFQNWLSIVGAILGIIGLSIEERRAAEGQQVPPAEPAPAIEEKKEVPTEAQAPKQEPKEEPAPAKVEKKDWFCPNCGAHNTGKFCQACGTKKPE